MSDHVTYSDLARYITGRLDEGRIEEIAAHLQECVQCGKMMENMQWAKKYLQAVAKNLDNEHPAPGLVIAYLHGELEPDIAEWVERHLDHCDECLLADEVVNDTFSPSEEAKEFIQKNRPIEIHIQEIWENLHRKPAVSEKNQQRISTLQELLSKVGNGLQSLGKIKDYLFPDPISLTGLAPAMAGVEYAASGEGFEKDKKEIADSPFVLTLYKFGTEYRIYVKSSDPAIRECLLLVRFTEGAFERFQTLVLVENGEGEYRLEEDERIWAAPVKTSLQAQIETLWPLQNLRDTDKEKVACNFAELLEYPSSEIRIFILKVLSGLGIKSVLTAITPLENDPDERVRLAASKAIRDISSQ